ncbi:replication-relaxation family protein [Amycolatopsis aidingensis]|uniref:replication-relaxation family protein n=1 Tax=Amycolatopsis aidingensis TaxID=2842453 RepID=UPI001C0AE076|nr:replication-relaxation family protein [Amycolatopsis aidingensis]
MVRLDSFQRDALTAIYWHRLVNTDQLGRLVGPSMPARTVRDKLLALRRAGLVDRIVHQRAPRVWHVTEDGAAAVEAAGTVDARPYRLPSMAVADLLHRHALDVVETGLAFVETARAHGHDCGPLSWTPEVAHRVRAGSDRRDVVIADAVLHYVCERDGRRVQRVFFVEVDRATMPVARLARKLGRYVRYHGYVAKQAADNRPVWQQRYARFPRVLVVLSGAPEHVLDRRLADLRAHTQAMTTAALAHDRVVALATTLERLRCRGPLREIAVPLLGDDTRPVPVVGPPAARAR